MDGSQPIPEGTVSSRTLDRGFLRVPKTQLFFGERLRSLIPVQDRFAFFTIAPAYLWGRFREIVLADFLSQHGAAHFYFRKFGRPVFAGLTSPDGNPDWNFVLWAIEREHWDALVDHLCSSVISDRDDKAIFRMALQEFQVADPLFLDRVVICPPEVPVITVYAFAIKSNLYTAAFDFGQPLLDLPRLRFYEADEECTLYAQAVFRNGPAPFPEPKESCSESPAQCHPRDQG